MNTLIKEKQSQNQPTKGPIQETTINAPSSYPLMNISLQKMPSSASTAAQKCLLPKEYQGERNTATAK